MYEGRVINSHSGIITDDVGYRLSFRQKGRESMDKNNLLEDFKKTRIFKEFDSNQIQKILSACKELKLRQEETLFDQGADSDEIYFLIAGKLKVSSNNSTVSTIKVGGVVGEIGSLTNTPRSATIIAVFDSQLLYIKQADLNTIIQADPHLGLKLYRNAVEILAGYLMENNLALEFCKLLSS